MRVLKLSRNIALNTVEQPVEQRQHDEVKEI